MEKPQCRESRRLQTYPTRYCRSPFHSYSHASVSVWFARSLQQASHVPMLFVLCIFVNFGKHAHINIQRPGFSLWAWKQCNKHAMTTHPQRLPVLESLVSFGFMKRSFMSWTTQLYSHKPDYAHIWMKLCTRHFPKLVRKMILLFVLELFLVMRFVEGHAEDRDKWSFPRPENYCALLQFRIASAKAKANLKSFSKRKYSSRL